MLNFLKTPYIETKLQEVLFNNNYRTAEPYPHIVIDDLFDVGILEKIVSDWECEDNSPLDIHSDGVYSVNKKATGINFKFSVVMEYFLWQLSRPNFLSFLEDSTGIIAIIPDPYFFGGGLHSVENKGKLEIHLDYNKHFKFKLDRRLNLLIYLNKNWTEDNGGCLELWNHSMTEPVRKILPIFNRTVIFTTNAVSYHGHPIPVVCAEEDSRKSIALYYYTNGRPEENEDEIKEHSTLWQTRLNERF